MAETSPDLFRGGRHVGAGRRSKHVTVRMSEPEFDSAKQLAASLNRDLADYIRDLIRADYVQRGMVPPT